MKLAERKLEQLWRSKPPLWLRGLAGLYALGWRVYEGTYRLGLKRRVQMPVPVIGVGSLWAGGVGKTPVTIAIARLLHESGQRVVVLTHGYGGSRYREVTLIEPGEYPDPALVGDEAAELRLALPDIPIAVGKWRVRTAEAALARWSPEALVLDDGFQHLPLARKLDLVLFPTELPLGNGYCLPAGPLREPPSGLRRAGGVVMVENCPHPQPLSHGVGEVGLGAVRATQDDSPSPFTEKELVGEGCRPAQSNDASHHSPSPFTEGGLGRADKSTEVVYDADRDAHFSALTPSPSPTAWERGAERVRSTGRSPSPTPWERGLGGEGKENAAQHPSTELSRRILIRLGGTSIPTYHASITPTSLLHIPTGDRLPLSILQNRPLTLVCGIARPERFVQTAHSLGYVVECVHSFPDHHAYTPDELQPLTGKTVLTTAKDAVKLRTRLPETCDAYALLLEAALDDALQQHLLSLFTGTSEERRKL